MPLNVEFTVEKTDILIQESPPCLLKLTNTGPRPIRVVDPAQGHSSPVIRVMDLKTGTETLCRRDRPPLAREYPKSLGPRQSLEFGFLLLEDADLPVPGTYEVSVLYEYDDGAGKAESAPVSVTVRPHTAKNLTLVSASGGPSAILYGASVNVPASPPEIVWSTFSVLRGGGLSQVHPVAPANIRAAPVIGEPPRDEPLEAHWMAWLEGNEFHCTHFDPEQGPTAVKTLALRGGDPEIVAPLYNAPEKSPKVRPNGGALVCLTNPAGTGWRLQRINLTPEGAGLGRAVDITGPRPAWVKSQTRSTGIRLVTYIQAAGRSASLWKAVWPDPTTGSTPPRKLFEWPGEFIAAGSTLMEDDGIAGAALMWVEENDRRKLKLRSWRTLRGEPQPGSETEIPWQEAHPVEHAKVRVNADGEPAVLLREPDAPWQMFFEGKLAPVQGAFSTTNLPIEIVFLDGVEPILLCAEQELGFRLIMPDGRPLPPQRT